MPILVKVLRGLLALWVLIYFSLGLAIGMVLADGPGPGGWGAPAWVFAIPVGLWLGFVVLYFGADPLLRPRVTILMVAPLVAFGLGALFGTAPEFWQKVLERM